MEEKLVSSVNGVAIYGLISIGIFVVFFTSTLIWACCLTNRYLGHMGDLPLDEGEKNLIPQKITSQNYEPRSK